MKLARRTLVAALPALVLGLGWQGSRGLWEPDEGRNANVALGMLESGDWWVPRLNGDPYLDKPPLHFWSVAASMRLLGAGEWGARIPNALFFVVTAALLGALGRRMWDELAGQLGGWVYATTLAPFVAANVVTPDTGLAAFVVLLVYAYWRAEYGGHRPAARCGWWLVAGAACGLGLLTKGPAMLVFVPPLAVHLALRWRHRSVPLGPGPWLGATAAALLALAWYLPIVRSLPGAGAYLLDNQAIGRLAGSRYDRNPGWAGAAKVYLPFLLAGVLPWSLWWLGRGVRGMRHDGGAVAKAAAADRLSTARRPSRLRSVNASPATTEIRRRSPSAWLLGHCGPSTTLLVLWFALPLTVFVLASSRLPLYLLPLFAPFALGTGRGLALAWSEASRPRRRCAAVLFVAWCATLLGLKVVAARYPTHRDARRQAAWIAAQGVGAESTLVVVDTALNGLRLYGYSGLRWVRARDEAYPLFSPLPTLDRAIAEVAKEARPVAAVVSSSSWADPVGRQLATAGFDCEARTSDHRIAVLLCAPSEVRHEQPAAWNGP